MNNVLIDDRRIKVDFSQSVAGLWKSFKRGGAMSGYDDGKKADGEPGRSRMQLKAKHAGGHHRGAGASTGAGGTRGYDYVFVDGGDVGKGSEVKRPRR